MDMDLNIRFELDNRERVLVQNFERSPGVVVKQLDIGDFHVCVNNEPRIIIERKTINDLIQSIKDNRYHEQKMRLLAHRSAHQHTCQLFYLIEGNVSFDPAYAHRFMSNKAVVSAIINSMIRDKVQVVFTKNIAETALFLDGLMSRIISEPSKYFPPHTVQDDQIGVGVADASTYIDTMIKSKRKDNISHDACFLMQLSAIPGISSKKAKSIVDALNVKNMGELCDKLKQEGYKCLCAADGIAKKTAINITNMLIGT